MCETSAPKFQLYGDQMRNSGADILERVSGRFGAGTSIRKRTTPGIIPERAPAEHQSVSFVTLRCTWSRRLDTLLSATSTPALGRSSSRSV